MSSRLSTGCALFGAMLMLEQLPNAQTIGPVAKGDQPGGARAVLFTDCFAILTPKDDTGAQQSRASGNCLEIPKSRSSRFTFKLTDDLRVGGGVTLGSQSSYAGLVPRMQARVGLTYRIPGGFEFTAEVVGRRGYELPLFLTEEAGGDRLPLAAGSPMVDSTLQPMLWDTVLRLDKHLLTIGPARVSLIGEGHNLFNVNPKSNKPATRALTKSLTAPAARFGLKVKF